MTAGLTPVAAFAADVTDDPASAPDVSSAGQEGIIDRPGDHDWFAVRSPKPPGSGVVGVRVTSTDPSCPGAAPLLISVHNPELSWMRTIPVPADDDGAAYDLPSTGARYLIAIVAADPACVGLQYELVQLPLFGSSNISGANAECRIAKNQSRKAAQDVATAKQERNGAKPKSQPRKKRELADAKKRLKAARNFKSATCHQKK